MNKIAQKDFEEQVIKSTIPVLVDVFADWCPPCRALSPILEKISKDYEGKISIVKIDSDESPDFIKQYKVSSLPTLIYFKDGKVVDSKKGLQSEKQIKETLDSLL